MLKDRTLTYISLFSCAGVGCYGFKKAGFECIATNELIERRLNVQRYNHKCRYDSGYLCEDITKESAKKHIAEEIKRWEKLGNDKVDVLIATPPCQGMSVANHKKAVNEIERNSLVVESVYLVQEIKPRFFLFENVPSFMKTGCTAPDGTVKAIGDVIYEQLAEDYIIFSRILNFKNYGSNSSRTRTVVIGVSKSLSDFVAPIELFPLYREEKTLRDVIGDMPKLSWGEINAQDFYHAFRTYPEEMRCWIHDLKEGESAFDNEEESKRPHKVENGKIIINKQKNADKYTRQYWNKVAPCIHTRNDQLASQSTVHPEEDRVFSIRELMKLMAIPDDFKWIDAPLKQLNAMPAQEKRALLKKEEIKIRQSIGEAVPTNVFYQIACNIADFMEQTHYSGSQIAKVIEKFDLLSADKLLGFIEDNPINCGNATLARIAELVNSQRENNAAYYTNKFIINEIYKELPDFDKSEIHILEPSVGVGNFLPFIFRRYEGNIKVNLDVVDIDGNNIKILKRILKGHPVPDNFTIRFIQDDFLLHRFNKRYDLVIGNPPFSKLKAKDAEKYIKNNYNKETTNTFEFFLEKAMKISDYVALITPKALLNTPEFEQTRSLLSQERVESIIDFGELGFKGVLVETICICVRMKSQPADTTVISLPLQKKTVQKQPYIMDGHFPYWIIYRDEFFDRISQKLELGKFEVFRDRQITNSNTTDIGGGRMRVLKSRNISDNGLELLNIPGYDAYIDSETVKRLHVYKYVNDNSVYLTPNMTYKPRVIRNVEDTVVNGSVAVLIPKEEFRLTDSQLAYFSSDEYRKFYKIARNYQTRSLNVDAASVFFYGILRERKMDAGTIEQFLNENNYDVRKSGNGRWIDQKCTMDVMCLVADCIIEYTAENPDRTFTVNDIRYSKYAVENVQQIFCKPDPLKAAFREYDKYFGQPIKLLDAAGIIRGSRSGRSYVYSVINRDILEYISFREKNSYTFLCLYIEKVLKDSGIYPKFEQFFAQQDKNTFKQLKDAYVKFTIRYTPINKETECGRIFTKVLNSLACKYRKRGTEKGHLSRDVITQDMIMYNQRNWRDLLTAKPKDQTREAYEATLAMVDEDRMTKYRIRRAKRNLRSFNDKYRNGKSEIMDKGYEQDKANHMHHIFPVNEFPMIADCPENLIALTPTQHLSYAHPDNNTQYIDREYQYQCLRAKVRSVRENLMNNNDLQIYDFRTLQTVLNTGLQTELFYEIKDMDFDGILDLINELYGMEDCGGEKKQWEIT